MVGWFAFDELKSEEKRLKSSCLHGKIIYFNNYNYFCKPLIISKMVFYLIYFTFYFMYYILQNVCIFATRTLRASPTAIVSGWIEKVVNRWEWLRNHGPTIQDRKENRFFSIWENGIFLFQQVWYLGFKVPLVGSCKAMLFFRFLEQTE